MTDTQTNAPAATAGKCPFPHEAFTLPVDGTPLVPSPTWAELREVGPAVPLRYPDGHEGLLTTDWEFARAILEDERFSLKNHRFPLAPQQGSVLGGDPVDEQALAAGEAAGLLGLDGEQHLRIRKSITGRLSVRSARGYHERVREVVRRQLEHFMALGSPANLTKEFAEPISAYDHCIVLGIPDELTPKFFELFLGKGSRQQRADFVREVMEAKRTQLDEDIISDLLRGELTDIEVEGVLLTLFGAGRDSVAYMIATATNMLLKNPEQLQLLRDDPDLIQTGIEEIMRYGAMFVTVFPRRATEEMQIEGITVEKDQTVSASPVAANRDPHHWQNPEVFDLNRDAYGHLSFGHGPHGCVGQQFARMQMKEALTQLIAAMPNMRLVEAEQDEVLAPFASELPTYHAGDVIIAW
jgi:cytochrome P450